MQPLKIAIQKSGRLTEESLTLLKACDISFERTHGKTQLKTTAWNFPLEILFVRDEDIPNFIADGVVDLGIVGENIIAETEKEVAVIEKLNFSKCRLSLAVPKNSDIKTLKDLNNKKIATSYPKILNNFLQDNNIKAEIHVVNGSVEIAPSIGVAEAICDLVGTGSTLLINGLKELETVFKSEAVLIAHNSAISTSTTSPLINNKLIENIIFRIRTVLAAKNSKYILLNAPINALDEILSLLPSLNSPTVMPLADKNWVTVHSVLTANEFWEIVPQLKKAGAEGILVTSLEKLVP